jgi:membrane-bound lytic murein transglycosylase D
MLGLCLIFALVLVPGFACSKEAPAEILRSLSLMPELARDCGGLTGTISNGAWAKPRFSLLPVGHLAETIPDRSKESLAEHAASAKEKAPAVTRRVRKIAERLAADEEPIQNAFIHDPDELDDLAAPLEFKEAVDHYIVYFSTRKKKIFLSWLKRARHYVPLLKEILRDKGLPEDLVYLAMIESGFNPRAYSRMNASGPWQFISATGQRYGLRIDHWVDERRDFEKATVAAARYLKDLFDQFGCWYLAASGYNAGEGRVERAIRKHGTDDYWRLYRYNTLPKETREYIPQLIAAATISENPERYGFSDTNEEAGLPFRRKLVPGGTPLDLVAEAASSDPAEIRSLNPALMTRITPPGKRHYQVKVPGDAPLEHFDKKLESRLRGRKVVDTVRLVAPRPRALRTILKRYGVDKGDLALVNRGAVSTGRGKAIYVPLFERLASAKPAKARARTASYEKKRSPAGKVRMPKAKHSKSIMAYRGVRGLPGGALKRAKGPIAASYSKSGERAVLKNGKAKRMYMKKNGRESSNRSRKRNR